MTPEQRDKMERSKWLANDRANAVGVTITPIKTDGVERSLEELPAKVLKAIIVPAVKEASGFVAESMAKKIPVRSGIMRQAVGAGKVKLYPDKMIVYGPAGVRRGFGRGVVVQQKNNASGFRLKRLSAKVKKQDSQQYWKWVNPAKVAHIVDRGRKPIRAGKPRKKGEPAKALFDAYSGKFFGKSAKGFSGKHFVETTQATAGGLAQATIAIELRKNITKLADQAMKGQ